MTSYFQFRLIKLNLRDQRTTFESDRLLRHQLGANWSKIVAQRSYSKNCSTFKRYSFDDHFVSELENFRNSANWKRFERLWIFAFKIIKGGVKSQFLLHFRLHSLPVPCTSGSMHFRWNHKVWFKLTLEKLFTNGADFLVENQISIADIFLG